MRCWVCTLSLAASGMLVSGCGLDAKSEPEAAAAIASKPASVAIPRDTAATLVRPIREGKPGAAVGIKYDLERKPQVGVPLPVKVRFAPSAAAEVLEAVFSGMDGITLSGNLTASYDGVKSGELYLHEFTVTPQRTGVFYVTVNTSTRSSAANMARTFAIPFVVGTQTQPKPTPQRDASGKPIQPMQAEEPK
jgi:hypothetical protein